ncbi:hypothetical protein A2U01_0047111 [Trifolium medium]|uniref:Uncharacterized protein n=1 Tax=Trifolium medium TaxID=97028 RepID=A0A392QQJ9_9FABA|nr:hypothetical protein [Trifolium medium]
MHLIVCSLSDNKNQASSTLSSHRLFFVYSEKGPELVPSRSTSPFGHEASSTLSSRAFVFEGPYCKRIHEGFFRLFRN